jgi:hypothetical protein
MVHAWLSVQAVLNKVFIANTLPVAQLCAKMKSSPATNQTPKMALSRTNRKIFKIKL